MNQPREPLTPVQYKALFFIRKMVKEVGFPPTHKELGDFLGTGESNAQQCVERLVRKGYLHRWPKRPRGILPLD